MTLRNQTNDICNIDTQWAAVKLYITTTFKETKVCMFKKINSFNELDVLVYNTTV
jgi:hypothetical protein